jgi:5-deoxy-glucuronate isomerase
MTIENLHKLTPESAGWRYLGVRVFGLDVGDEVGLSDDGRESALVLVEGTVTVRGPGLDRQLRRPGPFAGMSELVYVPPGATVSVTAGMPSLVAVGSAPAERRHPVRVVRTSEMASELRGGGSACRQVTSPLAHPVPAERLIVYEAYVPRGSWAGWPPHRHDGEDGSPYLEEIYFFRFDRPDGFGFHRNYTRDGDYDEHFTVRDRSLVKVPRGYHVTGAAPAANMWILNFLAGSPDHRPRPPVFDQAETWITRDWEHGLMRLPAVRQGS